MLRGIEQISWPCDRQAARGSPRFRCWKHSRTGWCGRADSTKGSRRTRERCIKQTICTMSSWCGYCGGGNADAGKAHAATRLGASGSSCMRGNSHVQFRGGDGLVTAPSYPVRRTPTCRDIPEAIRRCAREATTWNPIWQRSQTVRGNHADPRPKDVSSKACVIMYRFPELPKGIGLANETHGKRK